MDAAELVLGTLSHFVKRPDGPPPGVPVHADAAFETRFAALCVDHGVAAIVTRSLDMLVLPPSVSRVTMARLKAHGNETLDDARHRLRVLARTVEALETAGVPALVAGDALAAATLYGPDGPRAVVRLELLVREEQARGAVAAVASEGWTRSGVHPVLQRGDGESPANAARTADESAAAHGAREARDVVEFHHYMSPLLLWNDSGDCLNLRFRVVRLGHPGAGGERAWERGRRVEVAGLATKGLAWEDQLFDLVIRIGMAGYADLAAMTDVGLLLERHADEIRWDLVALRARTHGLGTALHHVLRHVCRALALSPVDARLDPPRGIYEKCLDALWPPASIDYAGAPDDAARFMYGLAACGGAIAKLDWALRCWLPRPAWVGSVVGDPTSPMNWLEFLMIMREEARGARRRTPGEPTPPTDNVRRFERRKR